MNKLRIVIPGLFVALALGGCSDDSWEERKSIAADLCVERGTVCDPTGWETCDPTDGVCKCGGRGGLICESNTVCNLDSDLTPPAPSCVSVRCDGVVCETYEACDAADGRCKCQGELCGEGQVCLSTGCSGEDPCAGVVCDENHLCDPTDRICKCGGNSCSAGERCRLDGQGQGYCLGRLCVGKNCPAGTECNPADGLCHCGTVEGDVCTAGQACTVEAGKSVCEGNDICENVVCEGNTTCSPLDGKCHCGGYTSVAPICSSDQTCDPAQDPPRCTNGQICADITCTPGTNLSCDDETGACLCGGTGGVACAPGEGCVDSGGVPTCITTCNPNTPNVSSAVCGQVVGGPNRGCYLSPADGLAYCSNAGQMHDGERCEISTECAAGHHCVANGNSGVCRRYCDRNVEGACGGEDRSCVLLAGRPNHLSSLGTCGLVNP